MRPWYLSPPRSKTTAEMPAAFARSAMELAPTLRALGPLVTVGGAQVRLEGGRGRQGAADRVVDDLHRDVAGGPGDDQAGTGGRTGHLLPQPEVPAGARGGALGGHAAATLEQNRAHFLPAFPAFGG